MRSLEKLPSGIAIGHADIRTTQKYLPHTVIGILPSKTFSRLWASDSPGPYQVKFPIRRLIRIRLHKHAHFAVL
jgi:hypothetical protein